MKVNVDKVLERDAKLSELDSRAGRLISKKAYTVLLFVRAKSRCQKVSV